nr:putative signal transduction histidine kinase [uncultured bacterium]
MVTNLQTAREKIENSMAEVEQQNWLKTGQAELNDTMRGEQNVAALAQNIITYLANFLQAQIGTIYLTNEEKVLHLVGSYAYTTRKGNRNEFKFGEGLVGQAALEHHRIMFTNVPDDYIAITSGLGETVPRHIFVTPFLYEGEVKGVIELGTVDEFTERQRNFIEQVAENIAIAFNSTQVREKMQTLLEETQQQAEELQAQQEQLRVNNEELETQTTALRESEQKLQAQQEELRQTNAELAEQTHALEQQQKILQDNNRELEQARELVEEKANELELSSKYKSEFLSNMSHELRTPLNSLLILSRLLYENKDENLTDKQIEYSRTVHAAGTELLELINEVLDLSKIEAGRMVLNIEEMNLKGFTSYVEQHFLHIAEEKGLYLHIALAEDVPSSLYTDRQRVEQIVKNLLSNAMKFTTSGGITIQIDRPTAGIDLSRSTLNPQHAVAISVSDTGVGIPEEKQRVIFEAFQQADGTTSRKYGGTGLGLSITRELAKLLGGEIQLRSEEGKGSTFTLYLPEILTEPQHIEQTAKPLSDGIQEAKSMLSVEKPPVFTESQSGGVEAIRDDRHEETSLTDKFLLIIEDDPKFAKILFDLAREKGFKGLIAGDGAAGLQLADQYSPVAIILDIGLPGMDGWAVMEKLKKNPDTRHIPVHFMSAQDTPLEAMKMGAIGYLTKPVTLDILNDAFNTIEETISQTIKKLLVVEDDDTMRASMLELLNGEDVDITPAATGEKAYHLLQSERFDCMVLDLGLTDISGFGLLEKIKADATMSHIPIIVYTGKDLTKEEETKLKQHAESIIIKGVKSPERLLDEVTLFLHRIESDLPEAQQKKLRMLHDKEMVLTDKTILMVDDDIRNVFALSSVLEEKGMTIVIGENGKEALELLKNNPGIDLVLMDIMMPEMDGYEATRQIRKQTQFSKLPIIALTAKAMKGDRQKCIDAGANDYLSKPIDIDKLLSLLRVWLY